VQDLVTQPEYLDLTIPADRAVQLQIPTGRTAFAYVLQGSVRLDEGPGNHGLIGAQSLVVFGQGDQVTAATDSQTARLIMVSGQPIGEPVAWYGPIVMNTEEQLREAFDEYRKGSFVKNGRHRVS